MTDGPGWIAVALGGVLVVISCTIAAASRVGMWREVLVSSVRMTLQLLAVGLVLAWVFAHAGAAGAIAWVAVMVVIAGFVSGRRAGAGRRAWWVATAAIGISSVVPLAVLLSVGVIALEAQQLIPVGGMVVGSAMQGASLGLSRTATEASRSAPHIEAALSLGLSPRAAFSTARVAAVRGALVPIIDNQRVVGIITLPGAMTGLILAGVAPWEAIQYQIVVMFALMASWVGSASLVGWLCVPLYFDRDERLRARAEGAAA